MNILAISDKESVSLWDYFDKSKLENVGLIISCGDLDADYLSFLVTFSNVPVLYVCGNHDDDYCRKPPEGCICIEDDIFVYQGIRILGLGGSMRYRDGKHQYTESQMQKRIRRLWWKLKRLGGFDILVTHAPAYGIGDGKDLPHQGFQCFLPFLEKYRPKYFIHGHVHLPYSQSATRTKQYHDTTIINAYERYIFPYE